MTPKQRAVMLSLRKQVELLRIAVQECQGIALNGTGYPEADTSAHRLAFIDSKCSTALREREALEGWSKS